MSLPTALASARLRLAHEHPYLAAALWSLVPVERPGIGTLAVDRWWRLYYDPAVLDKWSVEEVAGVLYHEVTHLLRAHPERAEGWDRVVANLATDAEINDDLLSEKVRLPGDPVTPQGLWLPAGKTAEEYYEALLRRAQESAPQQGGAANPQGAGQGEAGPDQQAAGGSEAGAENGDSQPDADEAPSTASGSAPGGAPENGLPSAATGQEGPAQAAAAQAGAGGGASGSQPGDAGGSMPSAASAKPGVPSKPAGGPVGDGGVAGTTAPASAAGTQTPAPAPGAGRCGSCATGQHEPWEDPAPGSPEAAPGIAAAEAELLCRKVAEEILRIAAASQNRGEIPAHWRRWAEEKLSPRVDWRRELAGEVRRALADTVGAADYTYRRPSRRQVAYGPVIMPALRQPEPAVAVVVDTSGSISDRQLAQALAEVAGVLQAAGLRQGIHVLAVDAAVQECRRVFRPDQVRLAGGGGTDMRVGLEAALKLRPPPQVVVVITDGHTPWPDQPPHGVRVVVGLFAGGLKPPAWARVVEIHEVRWK